MIKNVIDQSIKIKHDSNEFILEPNETATAQDLKIFEPVLGKIVLQNIVNKFKGQIVFVAEDKPVNTEEKPKAKK